MALSADHLRRNSEGAVLVFFSGRSGKSALSDDVLVSGSLSRSDPAAVDALSDELSTLSPGGGPRACAPSFLSKALCSRTRAHREHATDWTAISCHFSASAALGVQASSCAAISSTRATSVATRTRLARTAAAPAARLPALAGADCASNVFNCLASVVTPEPTCCFTIVGVVL